MTSQINAPTIADIEALADEALQTIPPELLRFVGNVVIKFFEGLSSFIFDQLRSEFRRPPWGPIGYLFMRPGLARIRRRFDYERLVGAPLLGVNGTVLITHGRARRRMIGFAVEVGAAAAKAMPAENCASKDWPSSVP